MYVCMYVCMYIYMKQAKNVRVELIQYPSVKRDLH